MSKIIALDCDGVLLDYIETYQKLYEEMFNVKITPANPRSFNVDKNLGIDWSGREDKQAEFYELFAEKGWKMMNPLPGAIDATKHMVDMGYEIIVVTSMPEEKALDRAMNLRNVGIPFKDVVACGSHSLAKDGVNLKEKHLKKIKPEYFADDLLSNFHNVSHMTKCVFIDWSCENNDAWNTDKEDKKVTVFDTHDSLFDFTKTHLNAHKKMKM